MVEWYSLGDRTNHAYPDNSQSGGYAIAQLGVHRLTTTKKVLLQQLMQNTVKTIYLDLCALGDNRIGMEQIFEEAKTELGMDHYEVRKWPGWYPPYDYKHVGSFFSLAYEDQIGEKNTSSYSISTPAFA